MIDGRRLREISEYFKILGSHTRLGIIELIGKGVHHSRIAEELNVSLPAIFKHLELLKSKGIVKKEISGDGTVYVLTERGKALLFQIKKFQDIVWDEKREEYEKLLDEIEGEMQRL
jgi:predicted transcriptional regulator